MVLENCVIDVELFNKISSNDECANLEALFENKKDSGDFEIKDLLECICFKDILTAVRNKKCKVGINDKIIKDYSKIVKMFPDDVRILYHHIYSNAEHFIEITDDFDHILKGYFKSTPLEIKIHYIHVAHFLTNKTIISTDDYVNSIYKECMEKLSRVQVCCVDVCSVKDDVVHKKCYSEKPNNID